MKRPEHRDEDIAIIGMACLLPGAKDADTFWENILAKRSFLIDAPEAWVAGKFDPEYDAPELDRIYTKKVGLLGDLAEFDPLEFGVIPNSLGATEPDHFLALKLAARALAHAGYESQPFDRARTGIVLGRGATPNRAVANGLLSSLALDQVVDLVGRLLPELDDAARQRMRDALRSSLPPLVREAAPGLVSNVAVGRIANRLDLQGPSYMIDAACASTLIAVELAMKDLRTGSSKMMLAGGVQASMPPQVYMLFCQLGALSRTDAMPFDAKADGTLLAEGVGFLVLKPLAAAVADGNRIYAVLKGAGLASDGRAQGLLAPRVEGEILALQRAYEQSGIDPATVGLIEAHGTGIPVGDATELEALRKVFANDGSNVPRCALGSVKSMIGHCIPAAGIASLIKTTLALHYKILPPTRCEKVREDLRRGDSPFYVNTETRPWIHGNRDVPRRAGVNAFGFGGINSHLVLEEYPVPLAEQTSGFPWPCELVVISADTPELLARRITEIRDAAIARPDVTLSQLARTLSAAPAKHCRVAIVASDLGNLFGKLETAATKITEGKRTHLHTRQGVHFDLGGKKRLTGKTAFLFPGQGSQYPNMLADLCMAFPEVRHEFEMSDAAFAGVWEFLPSQFVFPPPTCLSPEVEKALAEKILSIDVAFETVFTASMAILRLLDAFGVKCDIMLGHSTGEYTSLAASGAVAVPDDDAEIELKRKLNHFYHEMNTAETAPRGSLLAVGAVEPEVLAAELANYGSRVHVAMDNCPHQKILFGQPEDIAPLAERLIALGGVCQIMPFNYAYHTPLIEPLRETLLRFYEKFPLGTPRHRLFSCASVGEFPTDPAAIRDVSVSQWSSTVRFRETIERLHAEEGVRFFIEVGPAGNLASFVEDTLRKREFAALATNQRSRSGIEQLLQMLAELYCHGFELDFAPLYQHRAVEAVDLAQPPVPKRGSRFNQVLDVSMPVMTMSDEMIAEIRREAGLDRAQVEPAPARSAANVAPAEPAPPSPIANGAPTADVMLAHEELMQQFLDSQRRCLEGLLAQAGSGDQKTS
jgi:acyl transferase domain-containing protein